MLFLLFSFFFLCMKTHVRPAYDGLYEGATTPRNQPYAVSTSRSLREVRVVTLYGRGAGENGSVIPPRNALVWLFNQGGQFSVGPQPRWDFLAENSATINTQTSLGCRVRANRVTQCSMSRTPVEGPCGVCVTGRERLRARLVVVTRLQSARVQRQPVRRRGSCALAGMA